MEQEASGGDLGVAPNKTCMAAVPEGADAFVQMIGDVRDGKKALKDLDLASLFTSAGLPAGLSADWFKSNLTVSNLTVLKGTCFGSLNIGVALKGTITLKLPAPFDVSVSGDALIVAARYESQNVYAVYVFPDGADAILGTLLGRSPLNGLGVETASPAVGFGNVEVSLPFQDVLGDEVRNLFNGKLPQDFPMLPIVTGPAVLLSLGLDGKSIPSQTVSAVVNGAPKWLLVEARSGSVTVELPEREEHYAFNAPDLSFVALDELVFGFGSSVSAEGTLYILGTEVGSATGAIDEHGWTFGASLSHPFTLGPVTLSDTNGTKGPNFKFRKNTTLDSKSFHYHFDGYMKVGGTSTLVYVDRMYNLVPSMKFTHELWGAQASFAAIPTYGGADFEHIWVDATVTASMDDGNLRETLVSKALGNIGSSVLTRAILASSQTVLEVKHVAVSGRLDALARAVDMASAGLDVTVTAVVFGAEQTFTLKVSEGVDGIALRLATMVGDKAAHLLADLLADPVTYVKVLVASFKNPGDLANYAWNLAQQGVEAVTDTISQIFCLIGASSCDKHDDGPQPCWIVPLDGDTLYFGDPVVLNLNDGLDWTGSGEYLPGDPTMPAGDYLSLQRNVDASVYAFKACLNPRPVIGPSVAKVTTYRNNRTVLLETRVIGVARQPDLHQAQWTFQFCVPGSPQDCYTANQNPDVNVRRHPTAKRPVIARLAEQSLSRIPLPDPDPRVNVLYGQPIWLHTYLGWWNGSARGEASEMGTKALVFVPVNTMSPIKQIPQPDGSIYAAQGITHNDQVRLVQVDLTHYRTGKKAEEWAGSVDVGAREGYGDIYVSTMRTDMAGPLQALDTGRIYLWSSRWGWFTWDSRTQANSWDVCSAIYLVDKLKTNTHPLVTSGYCPRK